MQFIDSHCHVDTQDFDTDRDAVLKRASDAGVDTLIVVSAAGSLEQAQRTVAFAEGSATMHATVGVHPHEAAKLDGSWWPDLVTLAKRPDVVAVGESGLDFYYDTAPRQAQTEAFIQHIQLAKDLNKPLVCHIRDAHDEATEILQEHAAGQVDIIMHCFTGTPVNARNYVDLGFYVSFSGIVTFKGKSAAPVREAVAEVPHDKLLIETDCPYLAPVPMRGKRNEPAFMVETAKIVAKQAGLELAELAVITVANTQRVFTLTSA